jgi:hypothetical protein
MVAEWQLKLLDLQFTLTLHHNQVYLVNLRPIRPFDWSTTPSGMSLKEVERWLTSCELLYEIILDCISFVRFRCYDKSVRVWTTTLWCGLLLVRVRIASNILRDCWLVFFSSGFVTAFKISACNMTRLQYDSVVTNLWSDLSVQRNIELRTILKPLLSSFFRS